MTRREALLALAAAGAAVLWLRDRLDARAAWVLVQSQYENGLERDAEADEREHTLRDVVGVLLSDIGGQRTVAPVDVQSIKDAGMVVVRSEDDQPGVETWALV